jgi:Phage integrase family
MMRLTSPCVDGIHTNANRAPVYRRTTTLKSGAVVGDRGGAELHPTQDQRQPSRRAASGGDDDVVRNYLKRRPRRADATAPLFPGMRLLAPCPTGVRADAELGDSTASALRQATALAGLTADEAAKRLVLDWTAPLNHAAFYKAVYRPAVLRANRLTPKAALSPDLKFHRLRHTYARLCIAAGRPPLEIARFMGHANPSITLGIYTHLFGTTTSPPCRPSAQ